MYSVMYSQRVKTRGDVKVFVDNSNDGDLLLGTSKSHCDALLKAGNCVCKIEYYDDISESYKIKGTGFLFGNGWILSNQHVLALKNEETSDSVHLRFVFPQTTFERGSRHVIFAYFEQDKNTFELHDRAPDLALIQLFDNERDELFRLGNQGLVNIKNLVEEPEPVVEEPEPIVEEPEPPKPVFLIKLKYSRKPSNVFSW
jgi:hypothetical protein